MHIFLFYKIIFLNIWKGMFIFNLNDLVWIEYKKTN